MALVLVFLVAVGTAALTVSLFVSILTFANTRRIMAQSDDLTAAVNAAVAGITKLQTDTATALTDIAAKLASEAAASQDPNLVASVSSAITLLNNAAASVTAIDTSIEAADPGAPVVTPTPPAV